MWWKKGTLTCLFFALGFLQLSTAEASPTCPASHIDRQASIKYVHDGDTVTLTSGEKIRLIGINAPEVARNSKKHRLQKAEPYANAARDYLKKLLRPHTRVQLQLGQDKKDHYGRTLAHLFLTNGNNIQLELLNKGLASALTIPPNTAMAECYMAAEKQARCHRAGLWSDPSTLLASWKIKAGTHGFHLIKGKVEQIEVNAKGVWLHLEGHLTLGIRPKELGLFDLQRLHALKNRVVLARGWLHQGRHRGFYMRIRHPLALQVVTGSCK